MGSPNGSSDWPTAALVPAAHSVNISVFKNKEFEGKIVVGVTCCLSIIGSMLILLSYFQQKKKTKAKHILFHISLMDLGAALTNLIGLSINFDQYYTVNGAATKIEVSKPYIDGLCKTQAFFAMFFSMGSVLWTTALATYLYVVIIHLKKPQYAKYILWASCVICYGLSMMASLWSVLTDKLGYAPYDAAGWCSLITIDPLNIHKRYVLRAVFIYDLWIYATAFLIIVIYIALKCFVSEEVSKSLSSSLMMWA